MPAEESGAGDEVTKCPCCGDEVDNVEFVECPRCKRQVCAGCVLITCVGGMCEDCAVKSEESEDAEEDDGDRREEFEWDDDEEEDEEEDEDED